MLCFASNRCYFSNCSSVCSYCVFCVSFLCIRWNHHTFYSAPCDARVDCVYLFLCQSSVVDDVLELELACWPLTLICVSSSWVNTKSSSLSLVFKYNQVVVLCRSLLNSCIPELSCRSQLRVCTESISIGVLSQVECSIVVD